MKGFIAAAALLASALRIAAQPVDTSVVERASEALESANRKLSERTALPSGATIARVRFGREDLWVQAEPNAFRLNLPVQSSFMAVATVAAPGGVDRINATVLAALQELASPFQSACAEIGGATRHDASSSGVAAGPTDLRRGRSPGPTDQLIGQHLCEVSGQAVFAFGVAPGPMPSTALPAQGLKVHLRVWTFGPRDVVSAVAAARVEAAEFAQRIGELRATGRPGTEVQVQASTLHMPGMGAPARDTWVCALLIRRTAAMMRVQVGKTALSVPASSVVPRIITAAQRAGLPSACSPLQAG